MWFKSRNFFTLEELHATAAKNIRRPPLPVGFYGVFAERTRKTGASILDQWRNTFRQQLEDIASRKTRDEQRARTIEIILEAEDRIAIWHASEKAKHIEACSHLVEFGGFEKEQWRQVLFQRFCSATISRNCLLEIGSKLFKFDDLKQEEITLFSEYDKEIRLLDVLFVDRVFVAVHEHQEDKAKYVARIKVDEVNPILNEQMKLLALMKEQIINGLNMTEIRERMDVIDETKKQFVARLRNSSTAAAGKNREAA